MNIQPAFVPSQVTADRETMPRGIWYAQREEGSRYKLWLHSRDSLPLDFPNWAWVRLEHIAQSDVTSSFRFDEYLARSGVSFVGEILKWSEPDSEQTYRRNTPSNAKWARLWRHHISSLFEGDAKGLLLGVFAGDRKSVPSAIQEVFAHLGISHLLAVSGYHVGLVSSVFLLLLRFQNRHLRRLSAMGILLGGAFVWICGSPVSGVRSWIMLTLGWLSVVRGKRADLWTAWGVAACMAVLIDPQTPHQLGAQLSFLATGSLLALGNVTSWWRVPFRAQFATSALTLPAFGVVPWAFYPLNLAAGPVMMILGLTFGLAILGLPGGVNLAQAFADAMIHAAISVDRSLPMWSDSRRMAGSSGKMLLLPLSLFWVLRLVPGSHRQRLLRSSLAAAVAFTVLGSTCIHANRSQLAMWRLRGRPLRFLITDGYGASVYGAEGSMALARNAAYNLALEGPVDVWAWSLTTDSAQKKWIQPPFQAWIHRNASQMTSEPVPLE